MWTPNDQTKSVHISEVSTVVKLVYTVDTSYKENYENSTGPEKSVHKSAVST